MYLLSCLPKWFRVLRDVLVQSTFWFLLKMCAPTQKRPKLSDLFHASSLHGVSQLISSKSRISRVFWLFIVTGAFFGLCYELFYVFRDFINSPKATSTEKVYQNSMPFPDIVICDLNSINKTYMESQNISKELATYLQFAFGLDLDRYEWVYKVSADVRHSLLCAKFLHFDIELVALS